MQKESATERSASVESISSYHDRRSTALTRLEERATDAQRQLAEEREQLKELTAAMQHSVKELASSQAAEKERLAAEAVRLANLHATFERERGTLAAELVAERQKIEDARDARALEEQQEAAVREARRGELRAEEAALSRERERISRLKAAAVSEQATREAAALAELARIEHERDLMEEIKKKVVAERAEVGAHRAELERDREAFTADVDALKQLGERVQQESVRVRQAMDEAAAELAEGRRLKAEAQEVREAADSQKRLAEAAMTEVVVGRKTFEEERLATAKERKVLVQEKMALSRSAEATRLMQLQLVTSMTATRPDSPQSAATAVTAAGNEPHYPVREPAASPGQACRDEAMAMPTANPSAEAANRATTPERAWRRWVQPMARPQPIASTVSTVFSSTPQLSPAAADPDPPQGSAFISSAPELTQTQREVVAVDAPAASSRQPEMRRCVVNSQEASCTTASEAKSAASKGDDIGMARRWQDEWQRDYAKAATTLQQQSGFIEALRSGSRQAAPAPPTGATTTAAAAPPLAFTHSAPLVPPSRAPHLSSAAGGVGPGSVLSPPDWSPGVHGTHGGSLSSVGDSTMASTSRLSYQFPAMASLATPARTESNASTPSRSGCGGLGVGGFGSGYGSRASTLCHASAHHVAPSWYRGSAVPALSGAGTSQLPGGSSSSSMVSLHGVRLSSWGSLPSRSSSSPAHAAADTVASLAPADGNADGGRTDSDATPDLSPEGAT